MKDDKTNAMRMLERAGIAFKAHYYVSDGFMDGVSVAEKLGQDAGRVFKTLVAQGADGAYCVFVLPVAETLDLKKAAAAAGEKRVGMIPVRDIVRVTGYVRGGCSPVGMKKPFPTYVDETAQLYGTVMVSAGRLGAQLELAPDALLAASGGAYADLVKV